MVNLIKPEDVDYIKNKKKCEEEEEALYQYRLKKFLTDANEKLANYRGNEMNVGWVGDNDRLSNDAVKHLRAAGWHVTSSLLHISVRHEHPLSIVRKAKRYIAEKLSDKKTLLRPVIACSNVQKEFCE